MDMKRVSIQDLKAQLSAAIVEAESGNTIIVTRHNEPVAQLGPARPQHVQRGEKVGTGPIKPAVRRATRGRYLTALNEDRANP
jgi:prevent-host-death family protein